MADEVNGLARLFSPQRTRAVCSSADAQNAARMLVRLTRERCDVRPR